MGPELVTLPVLAGHIRADLRAGVPWQDTLRWIIIASDDFASLRDDSARAAFVAEPPPTGDARYDALLAGLAVQLCRTAGMASSPAWTREPNRYLQSFWWYGSAGEVESLRAYAWQRTSSCFRARGVVFNVENLNSA